MTGRTPFSAPVSPCESPSDTELVDQVRSGDEQALSVLLARFRPRIHTWAARYFAPFGDRDDLVQEALIAFYRAVQTYDVAADVPFAAFARMCVHRGLCSYIRSNLGRRHEYLNGAVSIDAQDFDQSFSRDPGSDTATLALTRLTLSEIVRHARAMLSNLEFAVLMGHASGQTYADLAATLGATVKAVDNALQRARRKVLDSLESGALAS